MVFLRISIMVKAIFQYNQGEMSEEKSITY